MPWRASSLVLTRVSSHRIASTDFSTSIARSVMSPALPMGVATMARPRMCDCPPRRLSLGSMLIPGWLSRGGRAMAQPSDWTGRLGLARALALTFGLTLAACGGGHRVATAPQTGQAPKPAPAAPAPAPATPAPTAPKIEGATATVGLLLPLSGPNAGLGKALSQAGQLALFETGDDTTALVLRDSETVGGPVGGAQAAMQEGATVILGPVFAAHTKAVAPVTTAAHVPIVSFTTDRTVAGPGVYVMGILPSLQVEREVQYAASQGAKRFAALVPSTPYGQAVAQALNEAVTKAGGTVVAIEYYDTSAGDFSAVVQKL